MTWPGAAPLERGRQQQRRPARRRGCRRWPSRSSATLSAATPSFCGTPCWPARGCPATMSVSTWSAVDAGVGEGVGERLPGRAATYGSRRTSPPTASSAGRPACASGRGTRRWRCPSRAARRGPGRRRRRRRAARPPASPPAASSALPGRPVRMSAVTTSAAGRRPARRGGRRRPSGPRRRSRRRSRRRAAAARRGWRWRWSCRRRPGSTVENQSAPGRTSVARQRPPGRLDAEGGRVLVVGGDGPGALATTGSGHRGDGRCGRADGGGGRPRG